MSTTKDAAARCGDEQLLALYARERRPRQLTQLTERFQPLVRSLTARYSSRQEPFEDLLQVANLGLIKAIQGYDPERGNTFTSYAVPTILGELRRHFRDRVWNLRLPRGLQESALEVDRALEALTDRLGRTPTAAELGEETGLATGDVSETLVARDARWTSSLDAPLNADDESGSIGDSIGKVDSGFDRVEADMAAVQATLEERERVAIELRFQAGLTQAEAGERMGCSQMQVSRLSRQGLFKLLTAVRGGEECTRQLETRRRRRSEPDTA